MGDRACLLHDWEQGDYISGSVFEDSVDGETLDKLVSQSQQIIKKTASSDNLAIAFSGGIDSVVVLHLAARCGVDANVMASYTPDTYPTHREYGVKMADRLGYELTEYVDEEQDLTWLTESAPIFPAGDNQWKSIRETYLEHLGTHMDENDIDFCLNGKRNEHNFGTGFTEKRNYLSAPEASPIKQWPVEYVMQYLDRWSIPIDPLYNVHTEGPPSMWWRLRGDQHESDAQCWYRVRKACLEHGYTDFWVDRIAPNFPDGVEQAEEYANLYDFEYIGISESRERGSDASPVIPNWYDGELEQRPI